MNYERAGNDHPNPFEQIVEVIWREQLASFDSGDLIPAESFFERFPELLVKPQHAVDVIFNEFELLTRNDDQLRTRQQILDRFPALEPQLTKQFKLLSVFDSMDTPAGNSWNVEKVGRDAALEKGEPIAERFSDRHKIGQGATATVDIAFDKHLQQHVAIKRLHPHLSQSQRAIKRLKHEAQTVARLHHPNIVPVYELFENESQLLLISRYVKGENLNDLVQKSKEHNLEMVTEWIRQIADALHYAHKNGVTHRDIKPSNIIIDENGNALLADFGLATFSESQGAITQTGELIGTPAYMSPEQAQGESDQVDFRTDVYSLGATLYFLLTRRSPFDGAFSSVIRQVIEKQPSPIQSSEYGHAIDLATIAMKCLEKSPNDRYQTAQALVDDLRRFQNGEVILAKQAGPLERFAKYVRRRPIVSIGTATILLLLAFLLGTLFQLDQVRQQRNRAQQAEKTNRKLLSSASVDAGRLAMQRGKPELAAQHFQNSLQQNVDNASQVHLALVDSFLSLGQVDLAAKHLEMARAEDSNQQNKALVRYWESELAAIGDTQYTSIIQPDDIAKLDLSKQHFLRGLDAKTSAEALGHFRKSIIADPYHHSARRMYLTMALSLARFDIVLEGTTLARQIYPDDNDFRLIEAIATACVGDVEQAKSIVDETTITENEKSKWLEFCDFLCEMKNPVIRQDAIEIQHLPLVAQLLDEFTDQYLPLLELRRWRFPANIGKKFSQLKYNSQRDSLDTSMLQETAKVLVEVHPEATLLAIVAENELKGANPIQQLEYSRDRFLEATQSPTFVGLSVEGSWIGLYTTAMVLNVVHQRETEVNRKYMIEAADKVDPTWIKSPSSARVFAITLINIQQWDRARPFIDRWIELASNDQQRSDAHWHLALWHKSKKNWSHVIETCDKVKEIVMPNFVLDGMWNNLRIYAAKQIQKVIDG